MIGQSSVHFGAALAFLDDLPVVSGTYANAVFRGFMVRRFPRLYAAASLKPARTDASCNRNIRAARFPRLYAAASLKRASEVGFDGLRAIHGGVFRGFMPRPH